MNIIKVTNIMQAFLLMFIRNNCRKFLTHDQNKITIEKQIKWFNETYNTQLITAYIYWHWYLPIGYAVVHRRPDSDDPNDARTWISGGIIKPFRGKHFGSKLFHWIVENHHGDLWLDVFKTNTAALRIYKHLNFRKQSEDVTPYGQIVVMKRKGKHV